MITLRIQAGDGGADASDFAKSLGSMISKTTGVSPVVDGSEILFHRL
jgi:protein subunit release factor B